MKRAILLIEDNEQNRYLTTFLLEKNNYQVIHAYEGIQAIELAQSNNLYLVLLDIQLPTMDGYTVARALRGIQSMKQTPIVAVTSYAMIGDKEKAMTAGCNGYIEKPIDPDSFLNELDKIKEAFETQKGFR